MGKIEDILHAFGRKIIRLEETESSLIKLHKYNEAFDQAESSIKALRLTEDEIYSILDNNISLKFRDWAKAIVSAQERKEA